MSKARDISKLVDASGNIVANNSGADARNLGIVKADGKPLDALDRVTTSATVINTETPYAGLITAGMAATATNALDVDALFNTTTTYEDATGAVVNQAIDLKKPRNGNWWEWNGFGFTGIPTTNCANTGAYDGGGGFTETFTPLTVESIFSAYTSTDELGGTYQTRTVQNCNCGSFNCRTNCNCNCACACACDCNCRD